MGRKTLKLRVVGIHYHLKSVHTDVGLDSHMGGVGASMILTETSTVVGVLVQERPEPIKS